MEVLVHLWMPWPEDHMRCLFRNSYIWALTASGELVRKCVANSIDPGSQVRGKQQTCFFSNGESLIYPSLITQAVSCSPNITWSLLTGYTWSGPLIIPVSRPPGRQQVGSSLGLWGLNSYIFTLFNLLHGNSVTVRVLYSDLIDTGGLRDCTVPGLSWPAKQGLPLIDNQLSKSNYYCRAERVGRLGSSLLNLK